MHSDRGTSAERQTAIPTARFDGTRRRASSKTGLGRARSLLVPLGRSERLSCPDAHSLSRSRRRRKRALEAIAQNLPLRRPLSYRRANTVTLPACSFNGVTIHGVSSRSRGTHRISGRFPRLTPWNRPGQTDQPRLNMFFIEDGYNLVAAVLRRKTPCDASPRYSCLL